MAKILLLNGSKANGASQGRLNDLLTETAVSVLTALGHKVTVTRIDDGYDEDTEAGKFAESDAVIYQFPVWWIGLPWTVKKYIDDVFTAGRGKIFKNDGRSKSDPAKKYGTGGLLNGKKYMVSVTWNAPASAFTGQDELFEGKGLDAVFFGFHKMNEYVGMTALPSFMCNDVHKNPDIEGDLIRFKAHLTAAFADF